MDEINEKLSMVRKAADELDMAIRGLPTDQREYNCAHYLSLREAMESVTDAFDSARAVGLVHDFDGGDYE